MSAAEGYYVGILCALPDELTAVIAMLDEEHDPPGSQATHDSNSYVLGRILKHNVVATCMPIGVDGLVAAATAATNMIRTFTQVRFCLMVGIGGGIPSESHDIRLGDVVVGTPKQIYGGVVQYDKGKALEGGEFELKGQMNRPPDVLLAVLSQIQARRRASGGGVLNYIEDALRRADGLEHCGFAFPSVADHLYCASCNRKADDPADDCDREHRKREDRGSRLRIHYGTVASGNTVVKDSKLRDKLQQSYGALCVEMEAAGLMNNLPCLVIRGICDYADSHKTDVWQPYAAMTAAGFAKYFLSYLTPTQSSDVQPVKDILSTLENIDRGIQDQLEAFHLHTQANQKRYEDVQYEKCLRMLKVTAFEEQKNRNPLRAEGTCKWILSHPRFACWMQNTKHDLLWITADPGCGKSVFARSLIDHELSSISDTSVCYFFFKDNEEQDNVSSGLSTALHQLFSKQPLLIEHALPAYSISGNKLIHDLSMLWRILLKSINTSKGNIICVFDALDECKAVDLQWLIPKISQFYQERCIPLGTYTHSLKFIVTSRPYDSIETIFHDNMEDPTNIRLRGENENDAIRSEIDSVIHKSVDALAKRVPLNSLVRDSLLAKLLAMEHRTYLWLRLAMDRIEEDFKSCIRPERAIIDFVPANVYEAYDMILSRVPQRQENTVKFVLQIILGARRPLTIDEMAIALEILEANDVPSPEEFQHKFTWIENRIRDWCGLFVFVNHGRFFLIHQTAKEYLVSKSEQIPLSPAWRCFTTKRHIEGILARVCTDFLLSGIFHKFAERIDFRMIDYENPEYVKRTALHTINRASLSTKYGLSSYAITYWISHVGQARPGLYNIKAVCRSALYDRSTYFHQITSFDDNFRRHVGHKLDHIAQALPSAYQMVALGHSHVLSNFFECSYFFHLEQEKQALLTWAALCGQVQIVNMMLERDGSPDKGILRPLFMDCAISSPEVIRILWQSDAIPVRGVDKAVLQEFTEEWLDEHISSPDIDCSSQMDGLWDVVQDFGKRIIPEPQNILRYLLEWLKPRLKYYNQEYYHQSHHSAERIRSDIHRDQMHPPSSYWRASVPPHELDLLKVQSKSFFDIGILTLKYLAWLVKLRLVTGPLERRDLITLSHIQSEWAIFRRRAAGRDGHEAQSDGYRQAKAAMSSIEHLTLEFASAP